MSKQEKKIPIQNIFYMLCYSWNILPEKSETTTVGSEDFQNIYDFLGHFLTVKVNKLIKRGFSKEYSEFAESRHSIRGRIDVNTSIRQQTMTHRKLFCVFDEFTSDIYFHQIIKYTLLRLLRYQKLTESIKDDIRKLLTYFSGIEETAPTKQILSCLRYDRNNRHYLLIMNICEFIYQSLIGNEDGEKEFIDVERDDKKMARVFEEFLRNFYKHHLPEKDYRVSSPKISWKLDSAYEKSYLLPDMRTDIVIKQRPSNWLVIDAKYYSKTLAESYRTDGGNKRVHTGNLYQMFAYLSNWDEKKYPDSVKGMLIYPRVFQDVDETMYLEGGKTIRVCTVNLNADWKEIENTLLQYVEEYI